MSTLNAHSNAPLYSNMVSRTLAVDGVDCYIWYSEEGPVWAAAPCSPFLAVPIVTVHSSTTSVSTTYFSTWHYNYLCTLKS